MHSTKKIKKQKTIYKPSKKVRRIFRDAHRAKINFFVGAVRSAKTFTQIDLFIKEVQELPECDVLISGYSISSVARNVVAPLKDIIDPHELGLFRMIRDDKDEYLVIDWRGFRGKKFYIRGAGKENDFKNIQGATFGYWLADEFTRHSESFVDMAFSRLSLPYSRGCWTTNPDHPNHFVKKRFIDDPSLYDRDANGYATVQLSNFTLKDNPSLSKQYVAQLGLFYTGVFYKRYIESLWAMAEGTIYDFFDFSQGICSVMVEW